MWKKTALGAVAGISLLAGTTVSAFADTSQTSPQTSPAAQTNSTQSSVSAVNITSAEVQVMKHVKVSVVNGHLKMGAVPAGLSPQAVANMRRGVKRINQSIASGYMKIENGKAVLTPQAKKNSSSTTLSPSVSVTSYGWWGANIYFDQYQTQDEIAALNNTGAVWGLTATIVGLLSPIPVLGEVGSAIAVICAAITAAGAFIIANDMSAADHGDGVTMLLRTWGWFSVKSGYVVS